MHLCRLSECLNLKLFLHPWTTQEDRCLRFVRFSLFACTFAFGLSELGLSLCLQSPAEFAGESERRCCHNHLAQDDRGEDGAEVQGRI